MKKLKLFPALAVPFLLAGCEMLDVHPYDAKVDGPTGINARNAARIEAACAGRDSVRFVVVSDTQRWYDETKAAVDHINARGDVDFVIHCGDLTDFGATKEFEWMRRELERLEVPYVCLIGNHDCLGTGDDVFRVMFGDPDFSFNAGDTHFLCLNTNAFEYDYSEPIPDFAFMRTDREGLPPEVTRTVTAMHAMPYTDQFNNNVAELFQEELRKYPGLQFCLCGHQHTTAQFEPFGDGVVYYECGSAVKRDYLLFTLTKDGGMKYEVVHY